MPRENFFEAFNRDIITDGALSLAGAYAGNYLSEWAETSYLLESLVPKILGGIFAAGGLAIGIPYTINGILNSTCDIAKGGWVGSDICKSYDTANGN